jgi:hypothetical protein
MTLLLVLLAGGLDLSWEAPTGCPDAQAVRHLLDERLTQQEVPFAIHAVIHREAPRAGRTGRFVLRATIAGVTRTLENRECAALTRALVMMATLLAPAREPASTPAEQLPEAKVDSLARPALTPPLTTRDVQPDKSLGLGLGVRAGLHAFALPNATLTVVPGVFVETGAARFELGATYLLPQQAAMPGGGTGTADFAGVTASGCYLHPLGAWQLGGCVGGSVGALRVATTGISEPGAVNTAFGWFFAGPSVRLHVAKGFSIFASLDASVHVTRPKFAIATEDAAATFYQPAPLAMILQFGADVRWHSRIR